MKNLLLRSFSGLIYTALIVFSLVSFELLFIALCLLFAILGVAEFNKLCNKEMKIVPTLLDIITAISVVAVASMYMPFVCLRMSVDIPLFVIPVACVMARCVLQLYIKNDKTPLNSLAYSMMGLIYIVSPIVIMMILYCVTSPYWLLAMFIMIWLNDTGAYIVGSLLGRKLLPYKMFPRISPKKSWAGFFGGLLFTMLGAYIMKVWYPDVYFGLDLVAMLGLAAVIVVFATWGDLVESMIKRALDVKDSGNLIPGHGGILDRIDSLLFVLPAMLCYIFLVSNLIF